jgi:hypothetical protein
MKHALYSIAGLAALASPYSCHKPTPQEQYAQARHCHAVLDTALQIIAASQFKQANVDPSLVELASEDNLTGAYDYGKQIGMRFEAVTEDTERTRLAYLKSHTGAQKLDALREDVNDCLGDYYGRPND